MRNISGFLLLTCLLFLSCSENRTTAAETAVPAPVPAQKLFDPIHWKFSFEDRGGGNWEVVFTATIDKNWHLYSQEMEDGGPIPTAFIFEEPVGYKLKGRPAEEGRVEEMREPLFDNMLVRQYSGQVVFRQKIAALGKAPFIVRGGIEYMACTDGSCTPPLYTTFSIDLPGKESGERGAESGAGVGDTGAANGAFAGGFPGGEDSSAARGADTSAARAQDFAADDCGEWAGRDSDLSLWGIFIAGIIGGLVALFTPCVFPIIPLTVSFFIKQGGSRRRGFLNALIYALSIVVIYVSVGFVITKSFGPVALNAMASDAFFNMAFFIIFVVFAISFFGAFEIALPSSWATRADAVSEKGGLIGIFFMAFTLCIVSFSCTGPIIGTLLVEAAVRGNNLGPLVGMAGFSLALAVPFALFAAFPAWLNSLPKSGGWLNTVKVSLGFLELALALKFLSNVDLAYHWGFLKRELFISLWIVIFGMLGAYLLGLFRLSHDTGARAVSIPRLLLAMASLSFTVYLVPGLWGHPLKLVSGFPPPEFYKEWITESSHCPHNLNCFHDLEDGMAYARQEGKPVMLDFTGWSCVNCRRMEDYVWSDPAVLKVLSEKYVLISLYVDDKTPLPEGEQYYSEKTERRIRTVGDKWSELEIVSYGRSSQPWYVLLDHKGELLASPVGYTPDAAEYLAFLKEGLCRFGKR